MNALPKCCIRAYLRSYAAIESVEPELLSKIAGGVEYGYRGYRIGFDCQLWGSICASEGRLTGIIARHVPGPQR